MERGLKFNSTFNFALCAFRTFDMNRLKNPRLLLILSMAVFGSIAVFVRYIPLPSSEIALYRAAMALVLIGAFLLLRREPMGLSRPRRELPLLIASGVFMAFNWVLLFEAYKYTTVSNATLSYYFAPVIVTAASALFFRERLSFMQIFCFIMAIVGVVLITGVAAGLILSASCSDFRRLFCTPRSCL